MNDTMDTKLAQIVEPVRQAVEEIDGRLAELDAERTGLTSARRKAMNVLRAANPAEQTTTPPKKKIISPERASEAEERIETFLKENGSNLAEGFTRTLLYETMREAGVNGFSAETIGAGIERLQARGIVRADKKIRGGGMQYKIVGGVQ